MTPKQLDTLDFRQFHWRFSTDVLLDSTAVPPEQTQLARSTRLHNPLLKTGCRQSVQQHDAPSASFEYLLSTTHIA